MNTQEPGSHPAAQVAFTRRHELRKYLQDAFLILLITILLFALIEGGIRTVIRIRTHEWPVTDALSFDRGMRELLSLYRRHPFLNTAPREGTRVRVFGKEASLSSLGYRSPERSLQKARERFRILCAGGSTTFDTLAVDDRHTWPWELETMLRENDPGVEVFNAGFPGWSSLENLISLEIRDVDLEPDVIVLYQGINDLQPAAYRPFDRQYEHGHAERCVALLGFNRKRLPWYEHSLFFEKIRTLVLGKRDFWKWSGQSRPSETQQSEIPEKALQTFRRNIRSFLAVAGTQHARVVLATQPIRIRRNFTEADRAHLEEWIPGLKASAVPEQLQRLNGVLRDFAASGDAILADVAADIPFDDTDFGDPMHFTASGSGKMAEFMARSLRPLLPAAEQPAPPSR